MSPPGGRGSQGALGCIDRCDELLRPDRGADGLVTLADAAAFASGGVRPLSEQGAETVFVQDGDAELQCFVVLASGRVTGDHEPRLLAPRAADLATPLLNGCRRGVAAEAGQGAGHDDG